MNIMKFKGKSLIFMLFSFTYIVLFTGCKEDEPEIMVEKVTIKGYGANFRIGYNLHMRMLHLEAIVTPEDATNQTITWSSSDDKIAEVDFDGTVYFQSVGNVTIYATCGGVQGVANLEIFTQDLAAPSGFTITNIGTYDEPKLKISWDYMFSANYYKVYKTYQVESGGSTTKTFKTEDTYMIDSDISLGKTYTYYVCAFINEFEFSKYTDRKEINL